MNNNRNKNNNKKNTIAEWSFSSIVSMSLYYRGSSQGALTGGGGDKLGCEESLVFPRDVKLPPVRR